MYTFLLILHIIISVLLLAVILMQRGRGGGLVESLAGVESLFGTKTSSFLVRSTTILAICFFLTSTALAFLSKERGRSKLEKLSGVSLEVPGIPEDVIPSETPAAATPVAPVQEVTPPPVQESEKKTP